MIKGIGRIAGMLLLAALMGCGGGTTYVQFSPDEQTPTRVQSDNGLISALIPPEALDGEVEISLSDRSLADLEVPGAEGRSLAVALEFHGTVPAPLAAADPPAGGGAATSAADNRFIPATLNASVEITVRLAQAWPAATPLAVYSYNAASRRYEDAGISAALAEDNPSLTFSLAAFGRYALYGPLPNEYPLPAPAQPLQTAASSVVRRIEWQAMPAAAGYNLYRSAAGADSPTKLNTELLSGLHYVDILAQPGAYEYTMTALRDNGIESEASAALFSPAVDFDLLLQFGHTELSSPRELLFDTIAQRLLVSDPGLPALLCYDGDGRQLERLDKLGKLPLLEPGNLALDPDSGEIYLADGGYSQVFLLRPDLSYHTHFGERGTNAGEFLRPCGIVSDGNRLLIADGGRSLLQSFTPLGVYLSDPLDPADPQLALGSPQGMWRLADGSVALADTDNNRVLLLGDDFSLKSELQRPEGPASIGAPLAVVSDVSGRLFVSEPALRRISVFSSSGEYLFQFGAEGQLRVEFGVDGPAGLAYDPSSGYLYVADPSAHRIAVFTS